MPKDTRTYITVVDTMPDHPKIEVLSDAAFRLLLTTWCYCSRYKTDGHLKQSVWERRGTPETRAELEAHEPGESPLIERTETGIFVHDYTEHQRTAEEIEEQRTKRVESGRLGGLAKASNRLASASPVAKQSAKQTASKRLANGLANGYQTSSKSVAVSVSVAETDKTLSEGAENGSQTGDLNTSRLVAEWVEHCGARPPGAVVGQVAKQLGAMLAEGIPYDDVRNGLVQWQRKGLNPSTLPSVVHETRTARPAVNGRQQQTDDMFSRAMERAIATDARKAAQA